MIADKDTDTIYFSERLTEVHPETYKELSETLLQFKIPMNLLPDTKDIWARDYMPIQTSLNKFIEYRYDPDYLQGQYKGERDIKTYPDMVCASINLKTIKSDLIIDGGNIVKSSNCIILTDKVVQENRFSYKKPELIKKLSKTFEVEKIILIPWDKLERYGHADGMVKFIDDRTVLINEIYEKDDTLKNRLNQIGLNIEVLKVKIQKMFKYNWAYINFLQTKDLILLPKFNVDEDLNAFDQICMYYPEYAKNKRIVQIDMSDIVKGDGALNCISWTIKTKN